MTSPGLKRPLDLELSHNDQKDEQLEDATNASDFDAKPESKDVKSNPDSPGADTSSRLVSHYGDTPQNGSKRLRTAKYPSAANADHPGNALMPMNQDTTTTTSLSPSSPSISPTEQPEAQQQQRAQSPINEDLDSLIKDELNKEEARRNQYGTNNEISEPPILTARQTQSICEKLIRAREQKLRDEYDRKLASRLAEQYDLFAKAKYLNTFAEPAQSPTTSPVPTTAAAAAAVAAAAAAATSNSSITNAIAAAIMQQRSAAKIVGGAANSIMSSSTNTVNPVSTTCTAQNLPNLSNLAASLTANGHSNAIAQPHLTASYMRQNTAVALRQAQMQQQLPHQHQHQHPMQLQHPLQPHQHQLQHRNSICPNNNTLPLGPVLLTSNLDEQLAIPEALFTLFGVFGDVVRVKILFNKKDNALIQMADANQAQVAQGYLDKQKIFGKVVRVTRSKHQLVQMPREGNQSDAGLTKDFTNSPLHRFKIPGSRNYLNIYPPSNTLHISNIPPTVDESDLHKAFKEQCGFEFNSFKFFLKDRKMALMKFHSIEHATIALIKMHNFQMSEDNNLRVSFSKSSI